MLVIAGRFSAELDVPLDMNGSLVNAVQQFFANPEILYDPPWGGVQPDVKLHAYYDKNFYLKLEHPNALYRNPTLDPVHLAVIGSYMLERTMQLGGSYTLDSNAVVIDGKAYVIFGPPHSGKTTLSFLLAKELGGQVFSDNITVINSEEGTARGSLPSIRLNRFSQMYISQEEADTLVGKGRYPIAMMIHPLLSHVASELVPYNCPHQKCWDLTEQIALHINGTNKLVAQGDSGDDFYVLPPLDCEYLANKRRIDITNLAKRTLMYSISGTYDQIIGHVERAIPELEVLL